MKLFQNILYILYNKKINFYIVFFYKFKKKIYITFKFHNYHEQKIRTSII